MKILYKNIIWNSASYFSVFGFLLERINKAFYFIEYTQQNYIHKNVREWKNEIGFVTLL